jgi:hypothetical protein
MPFIVWLLTEGKKGKNNERGAEEKKRGHRL